MTWEQERSRAMMPTRSELLDYGDVKVRVTHTRWRRKLVGVEIWKKVAVGSNCSGGTCEPAPIYDYTVYKASSK